MKALEAYPWPGNIRQLRNVIERAVRSAPARKFRSRTCPICSARPRPAPEPQPAPSASAAPPTVQAQPVGPTMSEVCKEAEINRIRQALERHKNNRVRAASELGISRMTLYKKLRNYGLLVSEKQPANA